MKKIVALLLMILALPAYGQSDTLKITVRNRREQPVRSIIIETLPGAGEFRTDRSGECFISISEDTDTILVSFPGTSVKGAFAVHPFSELIFNTSKPVTEAYNPESDRWITGREVKVLKKGEFDVSYEIKTGAKNLEDLLKRMPQLMVTSGRISLRNPVQTAQFSDTSPLIVVDGISVKGGIEEANRMVDINTIETIEVVRDGTLYGREALNGAIVIRLKK